MEMQPLEIKPGIYWVGGVDWNLRYFHGYQTQRGTTYNAYLIIDEKVTLIDTVKSNMTEEMLDRIKCLIDPAKIDYLVVNHVEPDHSGSVPAVMAVAPKATIVTSPNGKKGLERYYKTEWNYEIKNSGEELNIGAHTLKFVQTPMIHWPDNMVTYVPEAKLLFSNDAFGQHIASFERFDDEFEWGIICEEAAKYYANIVLLYGEQVKKALETLSQIPIEMIAPSHGLIWRENIPKILAEYQKWANNETDIKALIVYDTMWGSTYEIALSLQAGLEKAGVPVTIRFLQTSHISEIVKDVLTARIILIGSATINNGMLPSVSAFLTYIKGLRPKNRTGFAFGSYGWGGQGAKEVHAFLKDLGWDMPLDLTNIQYRPDQAELDAVVECGVKLGEMVKA
jgi:flavorubredoxin